MTQATTLSSPLGRPKERYASAFILAFMAACALFIPYIIKDQGYFLYFGDFNVQQVPFYKLAHEAVREGNIFWNFGTDLGANFIGSYSFYLLGSPFFWLTLPFPTDFVPHLMGPLLILKFSCASVAAYAYLTRFVKKKEYALLGGLLYAFSGFSVYNIFFNHFHEAIVYFPLLLLSMECLMKDDRRWPFIVMVALCSISNYYFFFGMVVFAVLYFILRVMSGDWDLFVRGRYLARDFKRVGILVLEAVLGLLLSAFMLLPAVLAITGNTRIDSFLTGWSGIVYSRSQIYTYILQCFFFPPDLPARPVFFPDADVKWSSVAGWLPVFGMTGVISWLACKPKTWQKRLIVICGIMAFVPVLNSIFSAFNYSYYARWFYMPILIMVLMTVKGLEDPQVDFVRGWKWSAGITFFFVLAVGLYPSGQYSDGSFSGFGLYTEGYQDRFLVTSGIAVVSLLLVSLLLLLKKRWPKDFTRVSIALVLVISVLYSSYTVGMGKTSSYDTTGYIIPNLLENYNTVMLKDAKGNEKHTYDIDDVRIDVYEGMDNTAMFFGMSSMNAFHSIVPGPVMEFYQYLGVERTVATRASTDYYALRSLLSVKYLFDYAGDSNDFEDKDGIMKMNGWSLYTGSEDTVGTRSREYQQDGYYIYENNYFIPYGFTYNYYMTKEYLDDFAEADRGDMLLKAILLEEEQIEKYGSLLQNIEDTGENYEGKITYPFYYNNCRDRAATACTDFATDRNGFTATAALERDNLVFFSIPYDEGWRATVDGKPVEIERVNIGFMAIPVTGDGQSHTIRFTYRTPGLMLGLYISGGALLFTGVYLTVAQLRRRKRNQQIVSEGIEDGFTVEALLSEEAEDYGMQDGQQITSEDEESPQREELSGSNEEDSPLSERDLPIELDQMPDVPPKSFTDEQEEE